ncbi:hypothetical protein RI129_006941 [Pyrocoelia pectoralis]|uniref:Uncharacterized protein n=1 Tax=Pyrocoelia pectoralis TaxID=417401 RepID=A0AAN7VDI0_9COLE
MKSHIVFSLFLATVYGATPELETLLKTEIKRLGDQCKAEMGATEADVAPLLAYSLPTTQPGKCFLACMYKKKGLMDADGKTGSADDFLEKIKPFDEDYYNKAKEIADICLTSDHNRDDECETAASLHSCWLEEKTKMGLPSISLD